jgi:hypothetical protein
MFKGVYKFSTLITLDLPNYYSTSNNNKLCNNCKFFISSNKKCKKFNDYALNVRHDQKKCGIYAKYFRLKSNCKSILPILGVCCAFSFLFFDTRIY